jgi:hypothetical protein
MEVSAIVKLTPAEVAEIDGNAVVSNTHVGDPGMPVLSVVGVSVIALPEATAVVWIT